MVYKLILLIKYVRFYDMFLISFLKFWLMPALRNQPASVCRTCTQSVRTTWRKESLHRMARNLNGHALQSGTSGALFADCTILLLQLLPHEQGMPDAVAQRSLVVQAVSTSVQSTQTTEISNQRCLD